MRKSHTESNEQYTKKGKWNVLHILQSLSIMYFAAHICWLHQIAHFSIKSMDFLLIFPRISPIFAQYCDLRIVQPFYNESSTFLFPFLPYSSAFFLVFSDFIDTFFVCCFSTFSSFLFFISFPSPFIWSPISIEAYSKESSVCSRQFLFCSICNWHQSKLIYTNLE